MCPTPARSGKIGDTQLDPTTREITICLSKSWLRALAIDLHTTPKMYSNEAGVDGYTKKNFTEITIRQI
jgi:hypothetical protein